MVEVSKAFLTSALPNQTHNKVVLARCLYSAVAVITILTVLRYAVLASLQIPLSVDEAQYWIWSRELAFGYFSKPPLLAWLIASFTAVCGDGESCVRASSPILHALTAVIVFGIGQRLYEPRVGMWSAATYLLLPGVSVSAVVASTDAPLLLFWALALYALVRALQENRSQWWLLLGAALGLGLLSKYAMLFFILSLAVLCLWDREVRGALSTRATGFAAAVAVVMSLPNVMWNATHDFVSYRHTISNMNLQGDLFHPEKVVGFILSQFGVFGPILFALMLWAVWKNASGARLRVVPQAKFCIAFTVPVIAVIAVQAFLSGANANWAAVAYVAATPLVCAWCLQHKSEALLYASAALHVFTAVVLYNYDAVAQGLGIALSRRIDPGLHLRGWDQAGAWSSQIQHAYPGVRFLFDDRTTMAELIYYASPRPLSAVMWNPRGPVSNYFDMVAPLSGSLGESFVYVTRQPADGGVGAAFDQVRSLGQWSFSAYPGHELTLKAFLLDGFRGYSALSAPPIR